jgi:hypothetical protein
MNNRLSRSPTPANLLLTSMGDDIPRLALPPRDAAKASGIFERSLWAAKEISRCRIGKSVLYPLDSLRIYSAEKAKRHVDAVA